MSQDRLELIGQQASILFENNQLRLIGEKEKTMSIDVADAYQKSYDGAIAHFVNTFFLVYSESKLTHHKGK